MVRGVVATSCCGRPRVIDTVSSPFLVGRFTGSGGCQSSPGARHACAAQPMTCLRAWWRCGRLRVHVAEVRHGIHPRDRGGVIPRTQCGACGQAWAGANVRDRQGRKGPAADPFVPAPVRKGRAGSGPRGLPPAVAEGRTRPRPRRAFVPARAGAAVRAEPFGSGRLGQRLRRPGAAPRDAEAITVGIGAIPTAQPSSLPSPVRGTSRYPPRDAPRAGSVAAMASARHPAWCSWPARACDRQAMRAERTAPGRRRPRAPLGGGPGGLPISP